ncbi:hypothetical protein G6F65_015119 [Rhizopus arrhizus]|nr:hypothetical protein G6F65_015119 [Rhizopus arrhizus]
MANAQRPVRQPLGQKLLGAIEAEIQRLHATERIGHHHLRAAGTADAGLRGQLERADRHLATVLAQAIDIQLDRGGHHRLAEETGGGGQHAIGLQAIVAADLQAAQAHRPGPVDEAAVEVANLQGHCLVGKIQAPARIQAHALATPAAVAGLLVATADRGVLEGAVADAEQAQFRAQAEVAERIHPAAIHVVVEQHAGRCTASGCARLRAAEHGGRQGQLVQRYVQCQGLHVGVIAHHRAADLVQVHRRVAAGIEAELAQHFGTGLQATAVVGEWQQAARRAVERYVQVQRLAGAPVAPAPDTSAASVAAGARAASSAPINASASRWWRQWRLFRLAIELGRDLVVVAVDRRAFERPAHHLAGQYVAQQAGVHDARALGTAQREVGDLRVAVAGIGHLHAVAAIVQPHQPGLQPCGQLARRRLHEYRDRIAQHELHAVGAGGQVGHLVHDQPVVLLGRRRLTGGPHHPHQLLLSGRQFLHRRGGDQFIGGQQLFLPVLLYPAEHTHLQLHW